MAKKKENKSAEPVKAQPEAQEVKAEELKVEEKKKPFFGGLQKVGQLTPINVNRQFLRVWNALINLDERVSNLEGK